jgi:hypothetical protein
MLAALLSVKALLGIRPRGPEPLLAFAALRQAPAEPLAVRNWALRDFRVPPAPHPVKKIAHGQKPHDRYPD